METDTAEESTQTGFGGLRTFLDQELRADSMAATTAGASGRTSGEKRAATFPLRSMRNFSKFQRMPGSGLVVVPCCVRKPLRFSRKASRSGLVAFGLAAMRDW